MTTLAQPQVVTHRDGAGVIGALITGGTGALFGFGGFLAVALGDDMIALDAISVAAGSLAILGLVGAIFVRYLPGYGAIGMAAAPIGYLAAFGGTWSAWWAKYQDAVATSGAAEDIFWSTMPAIGLFAVSGALLTVGALLAAFNTLSRTEVQ